MRLSEAMMLGSVTCKLIPADWNSCALGCAANAVGIEQATPKGRGSQVVSSGKLRLGVIREEWPWLRNSELFDSIWRMFDNEVCYGRTKTLEQLVDYVRSIEPSCGECCRFECTCTPTEVPEKYMQTDTAVSICCSCGSLFVSADTKTSKALHQEHAAGRLGHFYGPPTPLSNPCTNFSQVRHLARQEAEERRALMANEGYRSDLEAFRRIFAPTQPREQLGNAEAGLIRGMRNASIIMVAAIAVIMALAFRWGVL